MYSARKDTEVHLFCAVARQVCTVCTCTITHRCLCSAHSRCNHNPIKEGGVLEHLDKTFGGELKNLSHTKTLKLKLPLKLALASRHKRQMSSDRADSLTPPAQPDAF